MSPSPLTPRQLSFDGIHVGDEASFTHVVTEQEVQAFAKLSGDMNPLHLDAGFARRAGFGGPVVYGMLSASFLSALIGMLMPGKGALWASQTLQFGQPAFVGDTLRVAGRVIQKSNATRTLVLETVIANQHGQSIVSGESVVKMLEVKEEQNVSNEMNRTVLITGASRGIGAAIARRLAADGMAVVLNYLSHRDEAECLAAEINAAGGRAVALAADVADAEAVARLFCAGESAVGPINAIIHCAAPPAPLGTFDELRWDAMQQQWDTQIKGAFNCVKAAMPGMLAAQSGSIVFVGSVAADGVPPAQQIAYVVAKSALAAFARALAVEYGPKNIRVNVVAPGMTQTERIAQIPDKGKMLTRMQTPLRRLANPDDVASVASFLLGPGARHLTGETIRVCGGSVMV